MSEIAAPDAPMKRKIAAILAADIAGYSRLVADNEEETIARLRSHRQIFDALIERYGGRIFNTAGDAVMAEFASAVEAVRCAVDTQEALRTRNRDHAPDRQMHFRIGISIGDVIENGTDLLGDGVNIAARLEGLAKPGGICVSRSVFEQVGNKVSIKFSDIGEQKVKNIPTPVHAYVVGDGGVDIVVSGAKTASQGGLRPIAVGAAAFLALFAGAAAAWLLRPNAGPGGGQTAAPSPAPVAAVEYEGTMRCDKLPWTPRPFVGRAALMVRGGVAELTRPVFTVDGQMRPVGEEQGKGQVSAEGDTTIASNWAGLGNDRIEGVYTGRILPEGAELAGTQKVWYNVQSFEGRLCTVSLRRKGP